MKRMMILTVASVIATASVPSASARLMQTKAASAVKAAPAVVCSFTRSSIGPTAATATAKCTATKTHKPVKPIITYTRMVWGVGHTPCSSISATGTGGRAPIQPAEPQDATVTFTVRNGKVKPLKLVLQTNNDSTMVCGFTPKVIGTPASAPPDKQDRCSWGGQSTFAGTAFYIPKVIQCPPAWNCGWELRPAALVGGYTYLSRGELSCPGRIPPNGREDNYRVYIRNNVYYAAFEWYPAPGCRIPYSDALEGVTAFGVPSPWKGDVFWKPDILTVYPTKVLVDTDFTLQNGHRFDASSTHYLVPFGQPDPSDSQHRCKIIK